jgi:ABC-type transporter Mla subunit MlaD
VLGDLAVDQGTLRSLIRTGDAATQTLAARDDQIRGLMTVAAATFDTFASNSRDMEQAIEQLPGTLRQTRSTLGRLDVSLDQLEPLMTDLRPGARQLRPLAAAARPALAQLRATVPGARDAVHTMRRTAPAVTALLEKGTPFMKKLAPMLDDLSPIAGCLRPYAPELAGFFSNWTSYTQNYDDEAHYARVRVNEGQTSLTDVPAITTDQFIKLAGIKYAGLRPPGFNGGKPIFLPQCGVGQDAVDPTKDWEDGR